MSLFLAPIHTWLFNKVLILERIEKSIAKQYNEEAVIAYHENLKHTFGDYLLDAPLDVQIDTTNIHGWLQDKISKAESRQAALVHYLITKDAAAIDEIQAIYKQAGEAEGERLSVKLEEPSEIYKALNDVLLEGMPCDRVNSVLEQTPEKTVWETVHCVHKGNWENNGVDVAVYYGFRAALIEGFVHIVSAQCRYNLNDQNGQIHTISKQ